MISNNKKILDGKWVKFFFLSILFLSFAITIIRAIRWPNDWAEAHWLIGYHLGFLKRGVSGTVLHLFFKENPEFGIRFFSSLFLSIFIVVLFKISKSILEITKFSLPDILLVSLFLTSPYIVMSSHLIGYYDNIIILILISAVLLIYNNKIFIASVILSFGILVHETTLILALPLALFIVIIKYLQHEEIDLKKILLKSILLLALPLFTFLFMLIYQDVIGEVSQSEIQKYLEQFEFVRENRHITVSTSFTYSFLDYLKYQAPSIFDRLFHRTYLTHIVPSLLIMLWAIWKKVQNIKNGNYIFLSVIVVTLIPLSLHLIAWDTSRIWTYPIISAFLAYWIIVKQFDNESATSNRDYLLFSIATLIVIVLQLFIQVDLMDKEVDRFSNVTRVSLYAPLLIVLALICSNEISSFTAKKNNNLD